MATAAPPRAPATSATAAAVANGRQPDLTGALSDGLFALPAGLFATSAWSVEVSWGADSTESGWLSSDILSNPTVGVAVTAGVGVAG
ncbi:hypothetical protein A5710_02655 [Mycolicibacter sinensis]|uniref:Uncharacterized protein n=1 Tax=Mycolicibacter sinensis (strain JDM601) TaxID=875328 RepID=A0A1A2XSR4_MYCSD|nr:hypothetical protein A5710_02655 [Mycolicibacter sinensis]